jgi:hypothetical protein
LSRRWAMAKPIRPPAPTQPIVWPRRFDVM